MKTYDIHYLKTENLTPDEQNAMRRNARGVWLTGGRVQAGTPRAACAAYRKTREAGHNAIRLRAC